MKSCNDMRKDCNNRTKSGYCIALADTKFKKQCPFYKSKSDTSKGEMDCYHKEAQERP